MSFKLNTSAGESTLKKTPHIRCSTSAAAGGGASVGENQGRGETKPNESITRGGDISGLLDDDDIDRGLARRLGPRYVRARCFFDFRTTGDTHECRLAVSRALRIAGVAYVPLHLRKHWVLAITTDGRLFKIHDSAPSLIVKKDITRLLRIAWPGSVAVFVDGPTQMRGSNECGLFVVANALGHFRGASKWFTVGKRVLSHARRARNPEEMADAIIATLDAVQRPLTRRNNPYQTSGQPDGSVPWQDNRTARGGDGPMDESTITNVLRPLAPGSMVSVTWRYFGTTDGKATWLGRIFECSARKGEWPVEYRFLDAADGLETRVVSTLPHPKLYKGRAVEIIEVAPSVGHAWPAPLPKVQLPPEPHALTTRPPSPVGAMHDEAAGLSATAPQEQMERLTGTDSGLGMVPDAEARVTNALTDTTDAVALTERPHGHKLSPNAAPWFPAVADREAAAVLQRMRVEEDAAVDRQPFEYSPSPARRWYQPLPSYVEFRAAQAPTEQAFPIALDHEAETLLQRMREEEAAAVGPQLRTYGLSPDRPGHQSPPSYAESIAAQASTDRARIGPTGRRDDEGGGQVNYVNREADVTRGGPTRTEDPALRIRPATTLAFIPDWWRPEDETAAIPEARLPPNTENDAVRALVRGARPIREAATTDHQHPREEIETFAAAEPDLAEECMTLADPLQGAALPAPPGGNIQQRVAALWTLGEVKAAISRPPAKPHPVAAKALTAGTRGAHRRALEFVSRIATNYDQTRAARAILEALVRGKEARRWKWATVLKYSASIQGATKLLPMYVEHPSIEISEDVEWRQGLRYISMRTREEAPRAVLAVTHATIEQGCALESHGLTRAALMLTWLVAGRVGDILGLNRCDVGYEDRTGTVTVTYRRGKTIARRGPYAVHSQVPENWRPVFAGLPLDNRDSKLFAGVKVSGVTAAIRRADARAEARSIRRGALQVMAESGIDEPTLLLFSGHTSLATLRRYLQWGAIGSEKKRVMRDAARKLYGGEEPTRTAPARLTSCTQRTAGERTSSQERRPRFLSFLGVEAPSGKEFVRMRGEEAKEAKTALPLHLKDVVPQVTWERLSRLDLPEKLRTLAQNSFRWTDNVALYDVRNSHQRPPERSNIRFSDEDQAEMVERGKLGWSTRPEYGGGANGFPRNEYDKKRRRPIWEPFANDAITDVPTVIFRSIHERHRRIAGSRYAIARDFAAYYDQFPITEEVSQVLGAPVGGKWLVPKTLPMGLRSSCAVAQVATWCMTHSTEVGATKTESYIDNVLFHGPEAADVEASHAAFLQRCDIGGAQLNEDGAELCTAFEYLGEAYDLATQTRSVSTKNRAKLQTVQQFLAGVDRRHKRADVSKREFAAIVGIALYAAQVFGQNAAGASATMRYFRRIASTTHWDEWERRIQIPAEVTKDAERWVTRLLSTAPVPIWEERPAADATIIMDACESGWSAICVSSGGVETVEGRWPGNGDRYDLSVISEPRAIWLSLCRFVRPEWRNIVVVTDHEAMVLAANALAPKGYEYGEVLRKTQETYPRLRVDYAHIAGTENPMDGPSRGAAFTEENIRQAQTIAAAVSEGGHGGYGPEEPEWLATADNPLRRR